MEIRDYSRLITAEYPSRRDRKRKRKNRLIKIFAFFSLSVITIVLAILQIKTYTPKKAQKVVLQAFTKATNIKMDNELEKVVLNSLSGTKGSYAVAIKNLNTGEEYFLNEHTKFEAASLYKNWIMATTFSKIESGTIKENEILQRNVEDLNKQFGIASESAELTEGEVSFTVKQALERMITISHNYAALALTSRVKLSSVRSNLVNWELSESNVGSPPRTTALDMSLFLEKLYKGELGSPESTEKMIDLLKKQKLNHKIPKLLPSTILIAHKTGELGKFTHDAGIVYLPNNEKYILVVLSETNYPPGAEERISKISKAVYDYFSSQ